MTWGTYGRTAEEIWKTWNEAQDLDLDAMVTLTRTQAEMDAYFKTDAGGMFAFHREVIMPFMDWDTIKPHLKPEYVAKVDAGEEPGLDPLPLYRELVLTTAREYCRFAWGKAMDHRGLSASRSIGKLRAWVWLLDDAEAAKILDDDDLYAPYGVPILHRLSTHFGWDIPEGSEGTAGGGTVGRMMDGLPCSDACESCSG